MRVKSAFGSDRISLNDTQIFFVFLLQQNQINHG